MSDAKRKELTGTRLGLVGKIAVVGAKDRATNQSPANVVTSTDKETLQGFREGACAEGCDGLRG